MRHATKRRYIGSVPGNIALQACDIGEAVLDDGRRVYITWGSDQESHLTVKTEFEAILVGPGRGAREFILPPKVAGIYLPILLNTPPKEEWVA